MNSIFSLYYGNFNVAFEDIQNTVEAFYVMICIYNTAHTGMLSYSRQPQNYILAFGCFSGQVCMCFQNHQPLGRDPKGDKG